MQCGCNLEMTPAGCRLRQLEWDLSPAVIFCRLWLRPDAFEEEPDRERLWKQYVAALISATTAVGPTHNEPDDDRLHSSL